MASSNVGENETALWLHNKLGSTDDLWSGRSICSQLSKEKLQHIIGCFRSLQPHVKVKLLLSFLHLQKRKIAEDGEVSLSVVASTTSEPTQLNLAVH